MKKHRNLSVLLILAAAVFFLRPAAAFANSAQRSWAGIHATGAIVTDDACPVIVEEETLTFDISEFPRQHYENEADYLAYSGMVTARYQFYNPADYTVTATLAFPLGASPTYGYSEYDGQTGTHYYADDLAKFQITADGQPIEKALRHTLFNRYGQFDLSRDLSLLHDGFMEDAFYSPDMPVTRYTYTVSGIDSENNAATAAMDIPAFDGSRMVLLAEQCGAAAREDGSSRISAWIQNGTVLTLYAIGQPFAQEPEWKLYKDGGAEDGDETDGIVTLLETEELTFLELALSAWQEGSGVSQSDWYNAITSAFRSSTWEGSSFIGMSEHYANPFDLSDSLLRWYEYEITLEPGQRIVNAVEAPVYPSIDTNYEPAVYGYTYLLSPASTWASFGSLEIQVHTPYFMSESSPDGFTQTDDGYLLSLDGLPDQELTFTLSTAESPEAPAQASFGVPLPAAVFLLGGGVIIAGIVIIYFVRRKKAAQNR